VRHYVVVGAGAIGCYIGGALAAAGSRVSFIGRPRVVAGLRSNGLKVSDLEGRGTHLEPSRFAALERLAELAPAPGEAIIVLLCVKGGATAAAAREIAAALPAGTPVVSLQNGVENVARLKAAAPGLMAIAGMVPFNVVMPAPHHAHRATSGVPWLEQCPLTESLRADFAAAHLAPRLAADMRAVQWGKLLLNLNNPVNALSDLPLREELQDRDYRRVLAALISEALAALRAAGIKPAKVAASPPALLPAILRLPDWAFRLVAARMLKIDPQARSSMWDDILAGRVTEIDDLCGAVQRLAAAHALAAPVNAKMHSLIDIHLRGRRYTGPQLGMACGLR